MRSQYTMENCVTYQSDDDIKQGTKENRIS